jgi:hypothetical protein
VKAITTTSSITSSPFPQRRNNSEVVAGIIDQPQTREAGFQEACFKRDAYKCVITGHMDTDYFMEMNQPAGILYGPCVGAHIIPFAYVSWKASSVTRSYFRVRAYRHSNLNKREPKILPHNGKSCFVIFLQLGGTEWFLRE